MIQDKKEPAAAPLDRVQQALPSPLRGIPVQAMLAGVGLAGVTVLVMAAVVLRSDKAIAALEEDVPARRVTSAPSASGIPSATPRAAVLSPAELDTARAAGGDALASLAERFPDDPRVWRALGVARVREKKDLPGAVRALRRWLDAASDARAPNDDVQQALVELANGSPEVAAEALELLKTRMGSAGADLIFDLSQNATGKYAKDHAAALLDDPGLMKGASKALLLADELRRKVPCARKPLVSRAAADGDGRSLPFLRQMVQTKPCGGFTGFFRGSDCPVHACMTPQDRTATSAAIAAIEKRDPAAPRASASAAAPAPSAAPAPPPTQAGGAGLR